MGKPLLNSVSNKLNYKGLQGFCPLLSCNIRAKGLKIKDWMESH